MPSTESHSRCDCGPSTPSSVASTPDRPVPVTAPAGVERGASRLWSRGHIPGEAGIWIFIFGDMCLYGALFTSFMHDRAKGCVPPSARS